MSVSDGTRRGPKRSPLKDDADRGRPPTHAAMRCRYASGGEVIGDLAEALACSALVVNTLHDRRRDFWLPSPCRGLKARSSRPSPLNGESLELVDRDQLAPPGHLDRVEVRQKPPKRRATDSESLRGLASRVGQTLNAGRLSDDYSRGHGLC